MGKPERDAFHEAVADNRQPDAPSSYTYDLQGLWDAATAWQREQDAEIVLTHGNKEEPRLYLFRKAVADAILGTANDSQGGKT